MIELRKERRVRNDMVNLGITFTDPSVELEQVSREASARATKRKTIHVNVSATVVVMHGVYFAATSS